MAINNKAGSLPINTSCINTFFLMPHWNVINSDKTRVDDIMYPLVIDEKSLYSPQWAVTGKYVGLFKSQRRVFYIDTQGPHILFLSEIHKGVDTTPYRLRKAIWTAYYEDDTNGYLYQIVERNHK